MNSQNSKAIHTIGFLGTNLDQGNGEKRWTKWRPTISCCQQDFSIDFYHLIFDNRFRGLAKKIAQDIQEISPTTMVIPHLIKLENPWDFEQVYAALDDLISTMEFNRELNEYYVNITTGTHVAQICLFLLTETRKIPGKLLQLSPGSKDKGNFAAGTHSLIDLNLKKYDKLAMRFKQEKLSSIEILKSGIYTKNIIFNKTIDEVETVSIRSSDPILLTGPTGAGKSQLAKRIYDLKKYKNLVSGNFISVNCSILRGDTAISTLFGHKKGAFTGALADRPGLLIEAHKGICFLDEIGELGSEEQAMLLQAIEEKTFRPMGSDKEIKSDFQLICGTNKDLHKLAAQGKFRHDLLNRINTWTFNLPALRNRTEDIPANIEYELQQYANNQGKRVSFNTNSYSRFINFAISTEARWAGNFRDLNSAIKRMIVFSEDHRITEKIVEDEIERLKKSWIFFQPDNQESQSFSHLIPNEIDYFDKCQLESVIKMCIESDTLSTAGKKLFSESRKLKSNTNDADRLSKYLKKHGLSWIKIKQNK